MAEEAMEAEIAMQEAMAMDEALPEIILEGGQESDVDDSAGSNRGDLEESVGGG